MELVFQEEDFLVRTISQPEETEEALRLRHDVFREELKWVPPAADGLDMDEYDPFAQSIGIYETSGLILGHVRLIPAPGPFMIEKEFSALLPKDPPFVKKEGMVESTRICIRKDVRTDSFKSLRLVNLIYKAMYHWSRMNDIETLVTIVEKRYYVLLKRSQFPFRAVGDFVPLGEGVLSGIITMEWKEFDEVVSRKRPEFYSWFTNLPGLDPSRLLSHGLYSRR